jgi:hypothetical protein
MSIQYALIVVLIVVVTGYVASYLLKEFVPSLSPSLPDICKKWNKNHIMEITLAVTGLLTYGVLSFTNICTD